MKTVETQNQASLDFIMMYQFDPLIHRMMDKYGWTENKAREVFEDLKRFLYLATIARLTIAPTETIDEVWHNFILFTMDYDEFCRTRIGHFIHHRPSRRTDPKSPRNIAKDTLILATQTFGILSEHWTFRRKDGTIIEMDGSDCVPTECPSSTPSTNCQGEN